MISTSIVAWQPSSEMKTQLDVLPFELKLQIYDYKS